MRCSQLLWSRTKQWGGRQAEASNIQLCRCSTVVPDAACARLGRERCLRSSRVIKRVSGAMSCISMSSIMSVVFPAVRYAIGVCVWVRLQGAHQGWQVLSPRAPACAWWSTSAPAPRTGPPASSWLPAPSACPPGLLGKGVLMLSGVFTSCGSPHPATIFWSCAPRYVTRWDGIHNARNIQLLKVHKRHTPTTIFRLQELLLDGLKARARVSVNVRVSVGVTTMHW